VSAPSTSAESTVSVGSTTVSVDAVVVSVVVDARSQCCPRPSDRARYPPRPTTLRLPTPPVSTPTPIWSRSIQWIRCRDPRTLSTRSPRACPALLGSVRCPQRSRPDQRPDRDRRSPESVMPAVADSGSASLSSVVVIPVASPSGRSPRTASARHRQLLRSRRSRPRRRWRLGQCRDVDRVDRRSR